MRRLSEKRAFEWIVLSLSCCVIFANQISGSGVFEVRLLSMRNDEGRTASGGCCGLPGARVPAACPPAASGRTCKTYFRICLTHYQTNISLEEPCRYGENETLVLGDNSFELSPPLEAREGTAERSLLRFAFTFSWPENYSLIVEAWHDEGLQRNAGRRRPAHNLITRFAVQQFRRADASWSYSMSTDKIAQLRFAYRVVCDKNLYGPKCAVRCSARDDQFGHYTCNPHNGSLLCLEGWTGQFCNEAVCKSRCVNGSCGPQNECQCRAGWQGERCDHCIPYPGCLHGSCQQQPWQCFCDEGWGGNLCDQDLNYCTNHNPCLNKAVCRNTGEGSYTCTCPLGFTGTNCELSTAVCSPASCLNHGTCRLSTDSAQTLCECPMGFYGRRCERAVVDRCRDEPCGNGATCVNVSATQYRCACVEGFTGFHCEMELDECLSQPCQHGGRCVDEVGAYRCVCPPGYSGETCQRPPATPCASSPCLYGATCSPKGAHDFDCRCAPDYTGPRCQNPAASGQAAACQLCANGAACMTSAAGGISCVCGAGFKGRHCELRVGYCEDGACLNGATCIDSVDKLKCVCALGYHGSRCELAAGVNDSGHADQSGDRVAAVSDPSSDSGLTMSQLLLVVCLSVALSVLLLVLAVVLLLLRRRRRLARAKRASRDNAENESKYMNNKNLYPGEESELILPSGKIYTKNIISFDDAKTTNIYSHAEVHEFRKKQATAYRLGTKELNSVCSNVPLLPESAHLKSQTIVRDVFANVHPTPRQYLKSAKVSQSEVPQQCDSSMSSRQCFASDA